jgi:hypothetical protein
MIAGKKEACQTWASRSPSSTQAVAIRHRHRRLNRITLNQNLIQRWRHDMTTKNTTTDSRDRKRMLTLLWIFVMFNFTYGDILTLYFNNSLQHRLWTLFQSGTVGSLHITQVFVLLGALLLETAIAMVLLSWVLPYRANRWANIIVALIQILANVQALTGPTFRNLYFIFFTTIELACFLFIIWYAWTWRQPDGTALARSQSGVPEQAASASPAHVDGSTAAHAQGNLAIKR